MFPGGRALIAWATPSMTYPPTNLQEVLGMLLEDGDPKLESEFVGIQTIGVA